MSKEISDLVEAKKQELRRLKREKLLLKLGLVKIKQIKQDNYLGGVNYQSTSEEITYLDVNDEDLKELEILQKEIDSIKPHQEKSTNKANLISATHTPSISILLTFLGWATIILSLIVAIPFFSNIILSYVGIQILISGVLGGVLLISFAAVINYLAEISKNTK
jgi:hypothetical protein